MTMPQDIARLQSQMRETVKSHWKGFLIEGIVLVILGLAAIAIPQLASIAIAIFLGWMFLISGALGLYLTIAAREMPGFWWALTSAALAIIAGLVLLVQPVAGTLTLTIVVGVYFLAEGVATIMYALEHRSQLSGRWGWLLTAGIFDILVAGAIITGLPGTAAWAIGLLVGINLVFGGTSLIGMALAARDS
ncbi:HdeD family acid-resistance protein [Bradyrhizobium sp. SYSU BS000235]|uniref:HdeD family acid-resistance protein n=1 Tax=Bradyrhizobium sp. SYSU BS000235 TaxID=3411332 RepID=UPI003C77D5C8